MTARMTQSDALAVALEMGVPDLPSLAAQGRAFSIAWQERAHCMRLLEQAVEASGLEVTYVEVAQMRPEDLLPSTATRSPLTQTAPMSLVPPCPAPTGAAFGRG